LLGGASSSVAAVLPEKKNSKTLIFIFIKITYTYIASWGKSNFFLNRVWLRAIPSIWRPQHTVIQMFLEGMVIPSSRQHPQPLLRIRQDQLILGRQNKIKK
jgi:hypothetical protein